MKNQWVFGLWFSFLVFWFVVCVFFGFLGFVVCGFCFFGFGFALWESFYFDPS